MLPERLCLENVQRARSAGARAFSHVAVEVVNRASGRVHGVSAVDQPTGERFEFRAPLVVNAAGPWVDAVLRRTSVPADRMGGTRGTHLIVKFPDGGPHRPIYAEAPQDKRPFFIIPWRGVHLVGTTDVRVTDPDNVLPSREEIRYLTEALAYALPGQPLSQGDIWYAYAGIRPLPRVASGPEGAITRRHHIVDHTADGYGGLLSVIGGKLSTYLALGEQVTERLFRALRRTAPAGQVYHTPLVPGHWRPAPGNLEETRLWQIYGARAGEIVAAVHATPRLAQRICEHSCETIAQVQHAIRQEGAITVADILLRRTPAGWSRCQGLDAAPLVARLLGEHFSWDSAAQTHAVQAYREEVMHTFVPVAAPIDA
jgi:glycerol-3-phosphate dehydrogenase